MLKWLDKNDPFPAIETARTYPDGLLVAGGDLAPHRLIDAYRHGIFPWFSPDDPILWWSPDPRLVLFPDELKISRSLGKALRKDYEIRIDTCFETVMRQCAAPRKDGGGTWISEEMIAAYCALHELGFAHCVETWMDGKLAGGLYGIAMGKVFFGESMFSRASDASKMAFVHLVLQLKRWNFGMIDCQVKTAHLLSLGAVEIPRSEFALKLKSWMDCKTITGKWHFDHDLIE
ncbi:MAG: leucyl/phenylalanyl-tRNA--protein transferase [Burkholderiales bacterium]|nr:leucyl/phenylalanyl-tRNA--protein transferase [Burkholderiales bacterium]